MRIGIVLHPYEEEKPSGLERFMYELSSAIIAGDSQNEYLVYVKGKPRKSPVFQGKNWKILTGGKGPLWLDLLLWRNERSDIYLFNTPGMPLFLRPRYSVVIALDFAYRHLPVHSFRGHFKRTLLFWYHRFSLWKATHIIATSEATKKDITELFGTPEKKITVIYPGFVKVSALFEEPLLVPPHYFFYIGAIKERKNILMMVKAFVCFKEIYQSDYQFLIAGNNAGEYYEEIVRYLATKENGNDVVFLGYVTDGQAAYLHKHARSFIFTTLIEGAMGMPVLEAMDSGTPVITSRAPTSTEVGLGEVALLADPEDPENIACVMERIASDDALRAELVQKGKKFVERFDWKTIGTRYRDLLARIAH